MNQDGGVVPCLTGFEILDSLYSFCDLFANFFSSHAIASSVVYTIFSLSLTSLRFATVYFMASTGPAIAEKISLSFSIPRASLAELPELLWFLHLVS